MTGVVLQSSLRCPLCSAVLAEQMPTDSCQSYFECPNCKGKLRPKAGDCCVFRSYGTAPCPPRQTEAAGRACNN